MQASQSRVPSRARRATDLIVAMATLGASLFAVWLTVFGPQRASPRSTMDATAGPELLLGNGPRLGSQTAPIVVILFSDFHCPACVSFTQDVLPILRTRWIEPGDVRLEYRDFLPSSRGSARQAADAATCAHEQGRFWPMHDAIFRGAPALAPADVSRYAKEAGLDSSALARCLVALSAPASEGEALGAALGVTSTPTLILGAMLGDGTIRRAGTVVGVPPVEMLARALSDVRALVATQGKGRIR